MDLDPRPAMAASHGDRTGRAGVGRGDRDTAAADLLPGRRAAGNILRGTRQRVHGPGGRRGHRLHVHLRPVLGAAARQRLPGVGHRDLAGDLDRLWRQRRGRGRGTAGGLFGRGPGGRGAGAGDQLMSAGEPDGGYGTVYPPGPDLTPNGDSQGIAAGQLRSLPRRRRPGMIALAVALVGAGILASAALYQHEDHQLPVLVVTANVPAGSVISAADVATTSVAVGLVAATSLRPGSLLAPADLTTSQPPGRGQVLVPLPVRPSGLPASGLAPGDQLMVV